MSAAFPPYPSYKPSGLPWLGDVPAHWDLRAPDSLASRLSQSVRPDLPPLPMDVLSSILQALDEQWGNIPWTDADRIGQVIAVDLPAGVGADRAYQNARRNSDKQNARIEHDLALERVMLALLADHMELYKQYSDNDSFRQWVADTVFERTYKAA